MDDSKKDGVAVPATTTATVETTDALGHKATMSTTLRDGLPNNAQGNLGRIWLALGLTGFLVTFFAATLFVLLSMIKAEADNLRDELRQARIDNRQDVKDGVDRFIASRTLTEKRHAEVLTKLDRVMTFLDKLLDWEVRNQNKAVGEKSPLPKMPTK